MKCVSLYHNIKKSHALLSNKSDTSTHGKGAVCVMTSMCGYANLSFTISLFVLKKKIIKNNPVYPYCVHVHFKNKVVEERIGFTHSIFWDLNLEQ